MALLRALLSAYVLTCPGLCVSVCLQVGQIFYPVTTQPLIG